MSEKFPRGTSSVVAAKVAISSRSLSNKEEQQPFKRNPLLVLAITAY